MRLLKYDDKSNLQYAAILSSCLSIFLTSMLENNKQADFIYMMAVVLMGTLILILKVIFHYNISLCLGLYLTAIFTLLLYFADSWGSQFIFEKTTLTIIDDSKKHKAVRYGFSNNTLSTYMSGNQIQFKNEIKVGDCFLIKIEHRRFSTTPLSAQACNDL